MTKKIFAGLLFVSMISVAMIGCAQAPEQELSAAKAAVDSARTAQADKYVPVDFATAQDSLNAAVAEIEKQKSGNALSANYDKAKSMLVAALNAAKNARTKVDEEKAKIGTEIDSSLTKVTALVTETKDLLTKAPKGKEGQAALDAISSEITTIEASISEAQMAKADGNLFDAKDKVNAGIVKLDSIKVELTSAIEKATPSKKR